jgi:hypothetical protein
MRSNFLAISAGLVCAFLAAVGVGIVLTSFYALIAVLTSGTGAETNLSNGLAFIAVSAGYISASIALPTIIFAAVPHVIVSHRLGHSSWRYYLVSGIIIALIAVAVVGIRQYALPAPTFHLGRDEYLFIFSAIVAGAISALTFWKVARPDHLRGGSKR